MLHMRQQLSDKDVYVLREKGLIKDNEIVFKEGHAIIAEDLQTKQRRIVNVSGLMLEANKHVLLG